MIISGVRPSVFRDLRAEFERHGEAEKGSCCDLARSRHSQGSLWCLPRGTASVWEARPWRCISENERFRWSLSSSISYSQIFLEMYSGSSSSFLVKSEALSYAL